MLAKELQALCESVSYARVTVVKLGDLSAGIYERAWNVTDVSDYEPMLICDNVFRPLNSTELALYLSYKSADDELTLWVENGEVSIDRAYDSIDSDDKPFIIVIVKED